MANTIEGNTCYKASQMSSFWDRRYQTDNSFFGEEPSNFALSCYNQYLKKNNLKKILDLGCGQGGDTLFFVSEGIEISALDYSSVVIDGLIKRAKERNLLTNIHTSIFDARSNNTLPFDKDEFDAVYSHMFFNMRFTWEQMKFMFQEIRRVLRSNGFNFFSVRNHNDKSFGKGKKIDNNDDVYDLKGFEIRFFTKEHLKGLVKGEEHQRNIRRTSHIISCFNKKNMIANNIYLFEKIP